MARFHDVLSGLTPEQRDILEVDAAEQSFRCRCCETKVDASTLASHLAGKSHEKNLTRMIFSGASVSEICGGNGGESMIVV
jgi:hypothetical protein